MHAHVCKDRHFIAPHRHMVTTDNAGHIPTEDVKNTREHKDMTKFWSWDGFNYPEKWPVPDTTSTEKVQYLCAKFINTAVCTKQPLQKPVHGLTAVYLLQNGLQKEIVEQVHAKCR